LLQHRVTNLGIVEHRDVEIAAELLPHPILLLGDRFVELRLCDLLARDSGDVRRRVTLPKVVIDAEKGKRQRDQRQDDLHCPFVMVN
jgi:hypothetical protein